MSGYKQKDGKLRFDLIPPELSLAYAEVATFGIEKLKSLGVEKPERNWEKGLKLVEDHLAAAQRHINKWERGIDLDEESGLLHLKHAMWHIAGMITQIERGRTDLDDRPIQQQYDHDTDIEEMLVQSHQLIRREGESCNVLPKPAEEFFNCVGNPLKKLDDTDYLLQSEANAKRLEESGAFEDEEFGKLTKFCVMEITGCSSDNDRFDPKYDTGFTPKPYGKLNDEKCIPMEDHINKMKVSPNQHFKGEE